MICKNNIEVKTRRLKVESVLKKTRELLKSENESLVETLIKMRREEARQEEIQ